MTPAVPPKFLPTQEAQQQLHRRLMDGHHTAPADLADALFEPLVGWLISKSRAIDQQMCRQAAADATMSLIKDPGSYKPQAENAVGLFAFLQMAATRDLQNALRKEGRHHVLRIPGKSVEELVDDGKYLKDDQDAPAILQFEEDVAIATTLVIPAVREGLTEQEGRALDLLLQAEKKTAAYATALGIGHLPIEVQETEVKRVKDKLKKRIIRARAGHER